MPKRRNRLRELLREIEHIDRLKKHRRERIEELRKHIDDWLSSNLIRLEHRVRQMRDRKTTVSYREWYNTVYRNMRFRVVTAREYWQVARKKRVEYVTRTFNITEWLIRLPQRILTLLRRLLREIYRELINYSPIEIVRSVNDAVRLFRMAIGIRNGTYYAPVITVWKDRFVDIWIDRRIEDWLQDPQRFPAVIELLGQIAKQLLVSKYVLTIPPETIEQFYDLLRMLYEQYVSYARRMPCRRTQLMLRVTPVTFRIFKNMAVRMYIVRWMSREDMSSPYLIADRPIDIHFLTLMKYKMYGELISTMIVGGDTDKLSETDRIPTWRDARQTPRDMLRVIEGLYMWWKFTDGLARSIGRPENADALGDCSIYIRFRPPKNWLKKTLKRIDREYWRTYRWD